MMLSCNRDSQKDLKKGEVKLELEAELIRAYDSTYCDNLVHRTFDIELSIQNKSKNLVSFLMMSCSIEDNFLVNNDYIVFVGRKCSSNHEVVRRLKQNEKLIFMFKVKMDESTIGQSVQKTKFGLVYFEPFKLKYEDVNQIFTDKSLYDNIFWSNALNLKEK